MSSPLDPTPRTPEEERRIAEFQGKLDKVTRRLRAEGIDVEATAGFQADDQDFVDSVAANDAAVFVRATRFTDEQVGPNLPVLPVAEIEGLHWLERAVLSGRVTCRYYGIATELAGVAMGTTIHFRLITRGQETPLYVAVDHAPEDWKERALARVVVAWPLTLAGYRPFIATGPMKWFPRPIVVDPVKVGRNDPCPCGSGAKSKRCCFR